MLVFYMVKLPNKIDKNKFCEKNGQNEQYRAVSYAKTHVNTRIAAENE